MKTPVELVAYEIMRQQDEVALPSINARRIIQVIESAGYVIAHPEQVTEEMIWAGGQAQQRSIGSYGEPELVIKKALRAAPQWTKGNEG